MSAPHPTARSSPVRVTISCNTKQTNKAPLLLPAAFPANPRDLIFKAAKAKLRIKKPLRIFLASTGDELIFEADWKLHLRNDVTLLISAGEEYIGSGGTNRAEHKLANPECPVHLLAAKAYVDEDSITQLETTAHTLPGIVHAVGQPDIHPGNKFPIGAVFASWKWIHPPLIGGDIGCGMAWYKTNLTRGQVDGMKGKRVAASLRGLESPWRSKEERELWLTDDEGSCCAGDEWDKAVGTIGAGNHFAEIQVVEEMASGHDALGLQQDDVVLLVHSGSRGYGGSILKHYAKDGKSSLEEHSHDANEYLKAHDKACRWAKANRDLIALRFLHCLEPGEETWDVALCEDDTATSGEVLGRAKAKLRERKVVDIWHNNVERVKWPPSRPASGADVGDRLGDLSIGDEAPPPDYVYLHRKGAAPTLDPDTRVPLAILPLPGSRGTPTIILKPVFSAVTKWGRLNALSLAHGAGRSLSRGKALSSLGQKYRGQNLLEPLSDGEGTWVICDEKDLVYEEAPEAYKDVHAVAEDLVREGVAEIVGWCRARVSYKVRHEAR